MATKRLTAQQKRDREFMRLLDDSLMHQKIDLLKQAEKEKYERYMQGFKFGIESMEAIFQKMSWWERLTWKKRS